MFRSSDSSGLINVERGRVPRVICRSGGVELAEIIIRDAREFRHELLETAERLGLEHHALKSAPDIETLRDAGVESPSGRLVVDISRLREKRALSSGSNEIKVLGSRPPQKKPIEHISFLDRVKRILGL